MWKRSGSRWSEIQSKPESTIDSRRRLTSSDNDVALEVVSLGDGVVDGKLAALGVRDAVAGQLGLPLLFAVPVLVGVILGGDDHTRLVVLEVGDDVTPTLVVVDAHRDDEVLAGVRDETEGTAGSATTHREQMLSVDLAPRPTVSVLPDGLLDAVEESVRVGLVDLGGDGVTHTRGK